MEAKNSVLLKWVPGADGASGATGYQGPIGPVSGFVFGERESARKEKEIVAWVS